MGFERLVYVVKCANRSDWNVFDRFLASLDLSKIAARCNSENEPVRVITQFDHIGLVSDFNIDPSLDQSVPIEWLPKRNYSMQERQDILQALRDSSQARVGAESMLVLNSMLGPLHQIAPAEFFRAGPVFLYDADMYGFMSNIRYVGNGHPLTASARQIARDLGLVDTNTILG